MLAGTPVQAEGAPPALPVAPVAADQPAVPVQQPAPVPAQPAPEQTERAREARPDVVVTGRSRRGDPLGEVNAQTFEATQAVDKALVGPASRAYRKGVPGPIRSGLRNFLGNWREPVVFANFLLQLKIGKACETLGRFVINTTAGLAGVIDVAKRKPFNLPRRRNSFANTLGFYGVKPGPFFFLPLIGPTTLRDLAGNVVDQVIVPVGAIRPLNGQAYTIPIGVLSALDVRAEFDEELEKLRASPDPYAATRRYYLERRQAEIDALRGRKAPEATAPAVPPAGPPETSAAPSFHGDLPGLAVAPGMGRPVLLG